MKSPSSSLHRQVPSVKSPSSLHRRVSIVKSPSSSPHRQLPIAKSPSRSPHRQLPILVSYILCVVCHTISAAIPHSTNIHNLITIPLVAFSHHASFLGICSRIPLNCLLQYRTTNTSSHTANTTSPQNTSVIR